MDRAADNHYPTMTTDTICALPVPTIAAADCVLFLWATAPMLPAALEVMRAWGFEYKSNLVWDKDQVGTGYWLRNRHEHLLIGTRGNIPAPAPGQQEVSVVKIKATKHSRKPTTFCYSIEEMFPALPRVELFARGRLRPGWDGWGNEVEFGNEVDTDASAETMKVKHAALEGEPVKKRGRPPTSTCRFKIGAEMCGNPRCEEAGKSAMCIEHWQARKAGK